jgi:hypothetical protein
MSSKCFFCYRIVDFADGATDPIDFPIAPKFANDKLLKQTGMNAQQVIKAQTLSLKFSTLG